MLDRNYYVICDDNCKFPSMTYEQILEAIAEATGNLPEHVEDAFIAKIKESNHNATMTFWKGTQAEFNALGITAPAFKVVVDANGKLYFTPMSIDDVPAHASRHASGGEDELNAADIGALPESGGTLRGDLDMSGNKVKGLRAPTESTDAATKKYVDDNSTKVITFACGDGIGSETVRASGYCWLDTNDVLNIPIDKCMVEVYFNGFGRVGNHSAKCAEVRLIFSSDESDYFDLESENYDELTSISDAIWQHTHITATLTNKGKLQITQFNGTDEVKTDIAIYADKTFTDKTLKRIKVRAASSNVNLQNCIIRLTEIVSGDGQPWGTWQGGNY